MFDWAEVDPKGTDHDADQRRCAGEGAEAKRNEFTYGFGFEVIERGGSIPSGTVALPNLPPIGLPSNFTTSETTFYGPRGTVQYTRNNLRGKGESLSFTAFAGRLDQRGSGLLHRSEFPLDVMEGDDLGLHERERRESDLFLAGEIGSLQFQRAVDQREKEHSSSCNTVTAKLI